MQYCPVPVRSQSCSKRFMTWVESGTRCGRRIFIFSAGMFPTMRSKSNSAHSDFDRIAPVAGLVDDARGDIVWITLDVHAARRRSAKVGMVDERVVAKAEIGGEIGRASGRESVGPCG